jgi:glycosyltransferase involved in cell wall biosynthesis
MKILYVFHMNPADPTVQSGRPFSILKQMRARGHIVDVLVFAPSKWRRPYFRKALAALRGRRYGSEVSRQESRAYASAIKRRLSEGGNGYDLIFSPSLRAFSDLDVGTVKVACNDTLFHDLIGTYPQFARDDPAYVRQGELQEARALNTLDLVIFPSTRAIAIAKARYGLGSDKLLFAPFGGNLGWTPGNDAVQLAIRDRAVAPAPGFLFVGRDWERKDGRLVAATTAMLRERGLPSQAHFVGLNQPPDLPPEWLGFLHFHGKLPLATEEGARQLFTIAQSTAFFFLPSQAEAFGMSFVEAASLGLPLIGRDVGGISDIISPRIGFTVQSGTGPDEIAGRVVSIFGDRSSYIQMATRAHEASETKFNWRIFWDQVETRVSEILR